MLASRSSCTAAERSGRCPLDTIGWPFIDAGCARPSACRAVGATSMSWANGARPVLAEVSQPVLEKPGPLAIPTCSWGRPSLTSEIPARTTSVSPSIAATAARSWPTARSMRCRAAGALLRVGALGGAVHPGLTGVGELVQRDQGERAGRQHPGELRRLGGQVVHDGRAAPPRPPRPPWPRARTRWRSRPPSPGPRARPRTGRCPRPAPSGPPWPPGRPARRWRPAPAGRSARARCRPAAPRSGRRRGRPSGPPGPRAAARSAAAPAAVRRPGREPGRGCPRRWSPSRRGCRWSTGRRARTWRRSPSSRPSPTAPASPVGSTSLQVRPGTPTTSTCDATASSGAAPAADGDATSAVNSTTSTAAVRAHRVTGTGSPVRRAAPGRRRRAGAPPPPASGHPAACRRPASARAVACAGSSSTRTTASARAAASPTGTRSAAVPTSSGMPPARVDTSGVPAAQGLLRRERAALPARGQHARVRRAEQVGHVGAAAEQEDRQPLGPDAGGQLVVQRPVPGDGDQRCRLQPALALPPRDGVEQDVVALLRMQPAHGHQQRAAVVQAEFRAHLLAGAGRRRQRRGEGRGDADVAGAEPARVVGEVAGDGEHQVGPADGQPLHRAQQPPADDPSSPGERCAGSAPVAAPGRPRPAGRRRRPGPRAVRGRAPGRPRRWPGAAGRPPGCRRPAPGPRRSRPGGSRRRRR